MNKARRRAAPAIPLAMFLSYLIVLLISVSYSSVSEALLAPAQRRSHNYNGQHVLDEPPDGDFASNETDISEESQWCLVLVNKWNYIPDNYKMQLTKLANGQLVDKRIYPALKEMFEAARSDGVYPIVVSGYRTAKEQQRLLDERVAYFRAEGYSRESATVKAGAWVAAPGTSEHQLGVAVDINADGFYSRDEEVYEWLSQNSYRFGFICRYPDNKTEITGIMSEQWHYRYVGTEAAGEIYSRSICLEEYLGREIESVDMKEQVMREAARGKIN